MFAGKSTRLLTLTALALVVALSACREEEQGRIRYYEPGVYKGAEDSKLGSARLDELRQRAKQQAGS